MKNNSIRLIVPIKKNKIICASQDVQYSVSKCYERDSFLYQGDGSWILFVGACYNKDNTYHTKEEWEMAVFQNFLDDSENALKNLDGNFCGLFFNDKDNELLLFVDHLASIPLYYYRTFDKLYIHSDLFGLVNDIKQDGNRVKASTFGAFSMLAYSFMLADYTPIKDVYKVCGGCYYSATYEKTSRYFDYYSLNKKSIYSMTDVVDGIDLYFKEAVNDVLALDDQYNHLMTLSGGLDSRMFLLYALQEGYDSITTLNYSQSFYREETIAKKIAADCHCEHIFFSLDNGVYLSNIREGIFATQGMTTYRPILSSRMVWNKLQMDKFGCIHTGLLGDTVLGGYCIEKCNADNRFHSVYDFASQLNPKNKTILNGPLKEKFDSLFQMVTEWIPSTEITTMNSEKYILDNRYLNGLMQSYLGARGIGDVTSPYTSKKLMKFIFSYPSDLRKNHDVYFEWMNRYMPVAKKYQWENTGLKPGYGKLLVKPHSAIVTAAKKVDLLVNRNLPERSRNPYNYWMKYNNSIKESLVEFCKVRLDFVHNLTDIRILAEIILQSDNIYLLIRLATLLGTLEICIS